MTFAPPDDVAALVRGWCARRVTVGRSGAHVALGLRSMRHKVGPDPEADLLAGYGIESADPAKVRFNTLLDELF